MVELVPERRPDPSHLRILDRLSMYAVNRFEWAGLTAPPSVAYAGDRMALAYRLAREFRERVAGCYIFKGGGSLADVFIMLSDLARVYYPLSEWLLTMLRHVRLFGPVDRVTEYDLTIIINKFRDDITAYMEEAEEELMRCCKC